MEIKPSQIEFTIKFSEEEQLLLEERPETVSEIKANLYEDLDWTDTVLYNGKCTLKVVCKYSPYPNINKIIENKVMGIVKCSLEIGKLHQELGV